MVGACGHHPRLFNPRFPVHASHYQSCRTRSSAAPPRPDSSCCGKCPALYKLRPSARHTVYVSPRLSRDNLAPGVLLVDAEPLSCWDYPSSPESWPPLYFSDVNVYRQSFTTLLEHIWSGHSRPYHTRV